MSNFKALSINEATFGEFDGDEMREIEIDINVDFHGQKMELIFTAMEYGVFAYTGGDYDCPPHSELVRSHYEITNSNLYHDGVKVPMFGISDKMIEAIIDNNYEH